MAEEADEEAQEAELLAREQFVELCFSQVSRLDKTSNSFFCFLIRRFNFEVSASVAGAVSVSNGWMVSVK
jgi:hypothetical protein